MHATLEVNLTALADNYRLLNSRHAAKNCAAVVKANAYGLGAEAVSKALWLTGCRYFFVATLHEAIELRSYLPEAKIGVFQGIFAGQEKEFTEYNLTPVLNTLEQISLWKHDAILHIDTGMTRLGLSQSDLETLHDFSPSIIMSHLACANDASHEKNAEQLARFAAAKKLFPNAQASLANSAGIFLDASFHFDMARPGCALYGINPSNDESPLAHVATLSAPILQIRTLDRDETIGYGASYDAPKSARIAITAIGYADGYFRCLSNQSYAYVAGIKVPVAGRVSMDMVALDVSKVPEGLLTPSTRVEFINAQQTVDDVANQAGTIGYEIFTRIGRRVIREYIAPI